MPKQTLNREGLLKSAPDSIFTFTGRTIRPLDPDPADIDIEDIAHALANQCRWTGHVRKFYSVAEHSIYVAYELPDELQLSGLLHDATEAYLADLARPIKHAPLLGPEYLKYEAILEAAIAQRFDVKTLHQDDRIKVADDEVLRREAQQLMPESLASIMPKPKSDAVISCLTPKQAEHRFLVHFLRYGG